jgi:hypothetical protein
LGLSATARRGVRVDFFQAFFARAWPTINPCQDRRSASGVRSESSGICLKATHQSLPTDGYGPQNLKLKKLSISFRSLGHKEKEARRLRLTHLMLTGSLCQRPFETIDALSQKWSRSAKQFCLATNSFFEKDIRDTREDWRRLAILGRN